jgi:hypothetical protein
MTKNAFYKPPKEENSEESNLENEGAKERVLLLPSNNQETSCPERNKHDGGSEVVHHPTGKLVSQDTLFFRRLSQCITDLKIGAVWF